MHLCQFYMFYSNATQIKYSLTFYAAIIWENKVSKTAFVCSLLLTRDPQAAKCSHTKHDGSSYKFQKYMNTHIQISSTLAHI